MTKKERALKAVEILKELYPDAVCSLEYKDPFQLLVAVRLSAQCTDKRVNIVTEKLFAEYSEPADFAVMPQEKLEELLLKP